MRAHAGYFAACPSWSGNGILIDTYLITSEHGGNRIPAPYRRLFRGRQHLLQTHFGYDPGSLVMARALAAALNAPLVSSTVSRLLIDINRPPGHPQLYSVITRDTPAPLRAEIAAQHHHPYWAQVERLVRQAVSRGRRVIHISSHSFTPALNGEVRQADIGLLYDPARRGEAVLCDRWKSALGELAPALRVRRNYPYLGTAAGLTAQLRLRFPPRAYVGIELEVNQRITLAAGRRWTALRGTLVQSLRAACAA